MFSIGDLVDSLGTAKSDEDCWFRAKQFIAAIGGTALNLVSYDLHTKEIYSARSSMARRWLETYAEQNLISCDPFLRLIDTSVSESVIATGKMERSAATSSADYELNHQRLAAGDKSLFALKILGVRPNEGRFIIISSDQPEADFIHPDKRCSLRRIATVTGKFLNGPTDSAYLDRYEFHGKTLTKREVEVLTWLADGNRNDAIAHKMGLTEVTVRKHLLSARQKLGAATREEALVKAILQCRVQL